jgi:1-deoxy-D-xylulose-5-phosphate synthase
MKSRTSPFSGLYCPRQIAGLPPEVLQGFAEDARQAIKAHQQAHGGDLDRNLNAVDLVLALYSVFSSPPDVVVWDGGHQTFVHKLLSGRADQMGTSTEPGGLSGFPRRDESEHDAFGVGHPGSALSAALGMALARDLKGSEEAVVAVIEDSALATGLSLEALNHLGTTGTSLTLVINDGGQSDSAVAGHLLHLRTGGEPVLFESLGLAYIGPIDGTDIAAMQTAFSAARSRSGAVVVHVLTAPSLKPTATIDPATPSITSLMGRDPRVVLVGAGVSWVDLARTFPNRVIDTGAAVQHAVTLAAGLAARGFKPFCCIPSTFLQQAYDQVLHDVCLQHLPVRFLIGQAQLCAEGPTHHGTFDLAYLAPMPDLVVSAPSTVGDLHKLITWSHGYSKGPVAIRYPSDLSAREARHRVEPFRAVELIKGTGEVAYLALGSCVDPCLAAAEHLRALGIEAGVIDLIWAKPLDEPLIVKLASRTKVIVVAEEGVATGGVGQRIQALVHDHGFKCEVRLHNAGDSLRKWGPVEYLRKQCGLGVASLVESGL